MASNQNLEERLKVALADRYQIEREIGSGGMATVYLAQDLKHERQVAVKVLNPELAQSLGAERFLREIKTAANLTHPHILPVHDSGEADGFLFYVMPWVKGESLRTRLTNEKQLPVEDAIQITREIADALAYAHEEGVIHRDVKPANIMLEAGHAVLADFGVAHGVAEAKDDRITRTGTSLGTPAYMSPEQATGEEDLDGRSDQYALGCVLFEMLAGHPPFTGAQVEAVVRKHITGEPPSVTQARPSVPEEVAKVINRALAKSPADRFKTTGEMAAALALTTAPEKAEAKTGTKSLSITLGVAVLVLIGLVGKMALWPGEEPTSDPVVAVEDDRPSIAVLPFGDLSPDPDDAYFAGGLHDELLTQLTKVEALEVISRTSVMAYATRTKSVREIADELGASVVVEGSVTVLDDRLRVNVQLIDAGRDQHLWAERYDRTLDDVFAIQSEVAQQIVTALGVALGGTEERALTAAPTADAEAYRLYLQGREYYLRPGRLRGNLVIAEGLFERALALDPDFALAYASLSQVHGFMFWFGYDPSLERARLQREAAEAALRLEPQLPEGHKAMGHAFYYGDRDYEAALDEFRRARAGLPNDSDLLSLVGYVHRRLGNWDEVFSIFDQVMGMDPLNVELIYDLGGASFMATRRYQDAIRALDRALKLAPDFVLAAVRKGEAFVRWRGDLDPFRDALARLPLEADLGFLGTVAAQRAELHLWQREPDSLLAILQRTGAPVLETQISFRPAALYEAWAYELKGDPDDAQGAFEISLTLLDSVVLQHPDDPRIHAARGMTLAALGQRDGALEEADFLQRSPVYREDHMDGPYFVEARAMILARAGEQDVAIEEINGLLSNPGYATVHTLRLDPRWDPLRDHPRFQALLEEYADDVEH